jgi:hypothetical protein
MKNYYYWWIERTSGGQWFGWELLGDEELWRFEYDVERGTPNVRRMYRWVWTGTEWQYDTRNAMTLYVRAGQQRMAYFP